MINITLIQSNEMRLGEPVVDPVTIVPSPNSTRGHRCIASRALFPDSNYLNPGSQFTPGLGVLIGNKCS